MSHKESMTVIARNRLILMKYIGYIPFSTIFKNVQSIKRKTCL